MSQVSPAKNNVNTKPVQSARRGGKSAPRATGARKPAQVSGPKAPNDINLTSVLKQILERMPLLRQDVGPVSPPAAAAADPPVIEAPGGPGDPPPGINPPVQSEVWQSFTERVALYAPKVVRGSATESYLQSQGISVRYFDGNATHELNRHATQAAERALSTIRALGYLHQRGIRSVVGVYADPRDESLLSFVNSSQVKKEEHMKFVRYTPWLTIKDGSRKPTTLTFQEACRDVQSMLMVDVYHTSYDMAAPLNPQGIADMLSNLTEPYGFMKMIWIGRKFYGDAGLIHHEGAWLRQNDGYRNSISYAPSLVEKLEFQHDPCDWLWTGDHATVRMSKNMATLSWETVRHIGTMHVVAFSLTYGELICNNIVPQNAFEKNIIELEVPRDDFIGSVCKRLAEEMPSVLTRFMPTQTKIQVYKPLFDKVFQTMIAGRYSPTNFSRCSNTLINAQQEPEISQFLTCFPQFRVTENGNSVTWAIMLHGLRERYVRSSLASLVYGDLMEQVNDLHAKIGTSPLPINSIYNKIASILPSGRSVVISVICAFITRWLYRRWSRAGSGSLTAVVTHILSERLEGPWHLTLKGAQVLDPFFRVLVDPVWEELLKRALVPFKLGWLYPVVELLVWLITAKNLTWSLWVTRVWVAGLHGCWTVLPLGTAIWCHTVYNLVAVLMALHMGHTSYATAGLGSLKMMLSMILFCGLWNLGSKILSCFQKPLTPDTRYQEWKAKYYSTPWEERVVDDDVKTFTAPIPTYLWGVEEAESGLVPVPGSNCKLIVKGEFPVESELSPRLFYHTFPTNVPGYVPKVSYNNLKVAIVARLMQDPILDNKIQLNTWSTMARCYGTELLRYIGKHPQNTVPWDELVPEWLEHFRSSKKRAKYLRLVDELRSDTIITPSPQQTDLFVKHDEMLFQRKDGMHVLKPRIISNVDAKFQARIGPYIYAASKVICNSFSIYSDPIKIGTLYVHIVFAGSASDSDLSTWMKNVVEFNYIPRGKRGVCILVSGDDSLMAVVYPGGRILWFEGDFRMFDFTQGAGPLHWEYQMLVQAGCPFRWTSKLDMLAHNTYAARPRRKDYDQINFYLDKTNQPQRDTGNGDTYIGNSSVCASSLYFVVRKLEPVIFGNFGIDDKDFVHQFKLLGLEIKLQLYEDWRAVSFLKGMWYESNGRYCWGPLPSRFLKMGKCLRDPRTLYRTKNIEEAATMYCRDVANSYSTFLPVPIIRAFVARFSGQVKSPHDLARVPEYSTQASGMLASVRLGSAALESVARRYECEVSDILEVEEMISKSPALTLISHSLFGKLAARDYA